MRRKRWTTSKVISIGVLIMDAVATLAVLALCGLAILSRFDGALPYLTTLIGALQAVTVVVLGAYFSKSKSTYIGRFSQGLCDDATGEATLELGNGDKYKGTFKAGFYAEGVYTMSDGSYFKGTYKNAQPYNGKWYNADNSFSADVVNGVEQ